MHGSTCQLVDFMASIQSTGGNEHLDEDGTEEVVSNPCLCRGMKGGGGGRPQGRRKAECDDGRGGGGSV